MCIIFDRDYRKLEISFLSVIGQSSKRNENMRTSFVGQNYAALGKTVDVLSPMVYPSHYGLGVFGFDVPDAHPYDTVYQALMLSQDVLGQGAGEECAIVRPWLQAFTATWVNGHISYEAQQIQDQIQAVYDAGYEEWILWNATCRYPAELGDREE